MELSKKSCVSTNYHLIIDYNKFAKEFASSRARHEEFDWIFMIKLHYYSLIIQILCMLTEIIILIKLHNKRYLNEITFRKM